MLPNPTSRGIAAPSIDLPALLHTETADLQRTVEQRMGVPESVRGRTDYCQLLERLLALHSAIEIRLASPFWSSEWPDIGLNPIDHRQTTLLRDDLRNVGGAQEPQGMLPPELLTFGQALGCLYVVEVFALGGRARGPAIQTTIGRVPTTFFDGEIRGHPRLWDATQRALRRFQDGGGECKEVVLGARITFRAFGEQIDRSTWRMAG